MSSPSPASPWAAPRFPRRSAAVQASVARLRRTVTFTRFVAPETPAGAWRAYYEQWPFALQPPDARIYQLVDDLADVAGPTLDATDVRQVGPGAGRQGRDGRAAGAGRA